VAPEDNPSQAPTEDSTEQQHSARIPAWIWLGGALLVLLSLLTTLQTRKLQRDLTGLQDQLREQRMRGLALKVEQQRHEEVLALLTSPETREFSLRPSIGRTTATDIRVFWNDQKGLLLVGSRLLPAPPSERVFQLWVTRKDGSVVSCGSFRPDTDGKASLLVTLKLSSKDAQTLWITEEPEQGSAQPSSPPRWEVRVR
jgi:hypothetical protein